MLKILDKYIIRKFLSTFFFMLGVIMLLAMVFDISERMSEFIQNDASFYQIIVGYYLNFIVYYGNTFSPLIVFISVIWFTAKLAQDTEIIPMLNSGKPFNRILRPYFISATILMILSLVLNHMILPNSNRQRLDFEERYYRVGLVVENYQAEYPNNEFVHYDQYIAEGNLFSNFEILKFNKNDELIGYLRARNTMIDTVKGTWKLLDYFERRVTPPSSKKNEIGEMELEFKNDFIREGRVLDTNFQFSLKDIAIRENTVEAMGYSELTDFIAKEKAKGNPNVPNFEIELYQRTSFPFATYVLTLIAVSVSSRKKRGGIGVNLAIGFIFVFIYIFAMKVTTVAAIKIGFPPIAAVWIPNVFFGLIGYVLYRYAPK